MKNTKKSKTAIISSDKMVTIRLTDETGHSTLEQKIEDAIVTITAQHFAQAKVPWVGAQTFQFSAGSLNDAEAILADTIRLRRMLEETDEPIVVLTGALAGGAS